jgi:poly-gamma-glutamate synthesis protein (capsule biosynthesis protein)
LRIPSRKAVRLDLIDTAQIADDLYEARARKPHYIIVVMHWGIEYQLKENADQRRLARMLIRNGADLIIGMHPHVVQPIRTETARMPDGSLKEVLTVYSLGNFISNQRQPNTDGGILFQVDLLKTKGSPVVRLGKNGYIPVWRYMHRAASGKTVYYTLPIARLERRPDLFSDMPSTARASMLKYAEQLRKRLNYPEWKI